MGSGGRMGANTRTITVPTARRSTISAATMPASVAGTEACELFIATQKDHKQRTALREAPPPRGRIPKAMRRRERMERKVRTKRGRARYRRRGATVEPVFGQVKDRQGARRFSMRGRERCRGEWLLDAAVHNLRKLHSDSVRRSEMARKLPGRTRRRAA